MACISRAPRPAGRSAGAAPSSPPATAAPPGHPKPAAPSRTSMACISRVPRPAGRSAGAARSSPPATAAPPGHPRRAAPSRTSWACISRAPRPAGRSAGAAPSSPPRDGGQSWQQLENYRRDPAPWVYLAWLGAFGCLLAAARKLPADLERAPQSVADRLASDRPLELGDPDPLGYQRIAAGLSRFLRNEKTEPPLTVAITGEWGSGKSSLMNLAARRPRALRVPAGLVQRLAPSEGGASVRRAARSGARAGRAGLVVVCGPRLSLAPSAQADTRAPALDASCCLTVFGDLGRSSWLRSLARDL